MDEFIVCQKCGEQNPVSNNFCGRCSSPLREKSGNKIKSFRMMQDTGIHSLGCFILVIFGIIFFFIITAMISAMR